VAHDMVGVRGGVDRWLGAELSWAMWLGAVNVASLATASSYAANRSRYPHHGQHLNASAPSFAAKRWTQWTAPMHNPR